MNGTSGFAALCPHAVLGILKASMLSIIFGRFIVFSEEILLCFHMKMSIQRCEDPLT